MVRDNSNAIRFIEYGLEYSLVKYILIDLKLENREEVSQFFKSVILIIIFKNRMKSSVEQQSLYMRINHLIKKIINKCGDDDLNKLRLSHYKI